MLRLLMPVPGNPMDAWTPDSRAFNVSCNGPNWNDLENDLMPFSVMLIPAIVLSKLNSDFLWVISDTFNAWMDVVIVHIGHGKFLTSDRINEASDESDPITVSGFFH
jgi:hypothetical protein